MLNISENLLPPDFDSQHFDAESADDKELIDATASICVKFEEIQSAMSLIAQQIDVVKSTWLQARPGLGISRKIIEAKQEYVDLLGQLKAAGAGDPSEYGVLVKQRKDLEEKIKGFIKKRESLEGHQKNAEECLDMLYRHRIKITERREKFLKDTLVGNTYVQINIIPFGDKISVEEDFRGLIDRGNGGQCFQGDPDWLKAECSTDPNSTAR